MKTILYYWKEGEVKETGHPSTINIDYLLCPVVDTSFGDAWARYGMFNTPDESSWTPIPKEQFPKLFLVHLLLLGIN